MKKLFKSIALALATVTCFAFASCAKKDEVKVLKDILLTEEDYAFAIAKENDVLELAVNTLITGMKADGSLDALINSYFDGTATFTYENKTSEPAEGDFVMATNAYFPPFESVEGSKFKGVDIEIASKIANVLNKNLFVYDMEFDSIIPSVKGGKADIGMAGMTVTDDRKEQVDFAVPYYSSAQVLSVQKNDTTFDNCKTVEDVENILKAQKSKYIVGTQTATTGYMYSAGDESFGYDGFKNLTTKAYTTGALAMKDLSNGKINAVILDLQPSLMISQSVNASFAS